MTEMTRGTGMMAVEKRELRLNQNVFEGYLGNLRGRLRIPAVDEDQLPACQRRRVVAQGQAVAKGSPSRTSVSSF